jgi:hypothetical protein
LNPVPTDFVFNPPAFADNFTHFTKQDTVNSERANLLKVLLGMSVVVRRYESNSFGLSVRCAPLSYHYLSACYGIRRLIKSKRSNFLFVLTVNSRLQTPPTKQMLSELTCSFWKQNDSIVAFASKVRLI